jgi:hypothetical protein
MADEGASEGARARVRAGAFQFGLVVIELSTPGRSRGRVRRVPEGPLAEDAVSADEQGATCAVSGVSRV